MIGKKFNVAAAPFAQRFSVTEVTILGENETQWIVDKQLTESGNVIAKSRFGVYTENGKIFEITATTIIASALIIEGEIEDIFFDSAQDEKTYNDYMTHYNSFFEGERKKICDESDVIEAEQNEAAAELYFNQQEAARVLSKKPIYDHSQIKTNLIGGCMKGTGLLTIKLP